MSRPIASISLDLDDLWSYQKTHGDPDWERLSVGLVLLDSGCQVTGIESAFDLMSSKFGKYGEMNSGWSGEDVRGFSKIFGNQTAIWNAINKGE